MYSSLIVTAVLVLASMLFKYRINQSIRPWSKLLESAKDAVSHGDLASAELHLTEAVEYAVKQILAAHLQQLSRYRLAQVLLKSGQLDRAASLSFEILQQGRAAT